MKQEEKFPPGVVEQGFGAPCTVRPFARNPRVLVGWPLPLGLGLGGCLLLALATGTVHWRGMGGFVLKVYV